MTDQRPLDGELVPSGACMPPFRPRKDVSLVAQSHERANVCVLETFNNIFAHYGVHGRYHMSFNVNMHT